jgi:predicted MFS family arabinose efflux permease
LLPSHLESQESSPPATDAASAHSGSDARTVSIAICVAVIGALPAFLTGGLAEQMRSELRLTPAALGIAVAAFFATAALSSAPMGRVVEAIGARRGMAVTAVFSSVSLIFVAFEAESAWTLTAALAVAGIGNAAAHPSTHLHLSGGVRPRYQGAAFGLKQSGVLIATLLGGLATPVVALTIGWHWAFVMAAIGSGLLAAVILRTKKPKSTAQDHPPVVHQVGSLAGQARSCLLVIAVGAGLGTAAAVPLGAFVVSTAVDARINEATAGIVVAAGSGIGVVARVCLGIVADRFPLDHLATVASAIAIGSVGFFLLAAGSPGAIVAGAALAYAAGWGWTGLFMYAVVRLNPRALAAATGIAQTGVYAGSASGPLAFGLLAHSASFGTAWVVCGVLALVAAATLLVGRRLVVAS